MLEALTRALLNWLASAWPADMPLMFGPAEYLCMTVLLMAPVIVLAPSAVHRSLTMAVLGLLLGCIWEPDASTGFLRGLWGFYLDQEFPLVPALVVYGFLLPCVAAYATPADRMRHSAWRTIYNGVLMPHTLPALLLMCQPWLPARWVRPVLAALVVALGLYWELSPVQFLAWCLITVLAGWCALRLDLPWPPLLAGLLLQGMLESNLRRSLLLSGGNWSVYLQRPISATLLLLTVLIVCASLVMRAQLRRSSQA
jgi:TctA family transporter